MLNLEYQTSTRTHATNQPLPSDIVLTEMATRQFRARLDETELLNYRIFHANFSSLFGIDNILTELDPAAIWETEGISLVNDESITPMTFSDNGNEARAWPSGYLHLKKLQIVVARLYWIDSFYNRVKVIFMIAAPSPECVAAFRKRVIEIDHSHNEINWQIIDDGGNVSHERRAHAAYHLVVNQEIQNRIDTDVIGFFDPRVQQMYERLRLPYRRGVLMYGAPGNGKTSIIRSIADRLPKVSAILCRPGSGFDTDTLTSLFSQWKEQAPALLVLEDIDYLLERVNTSTFLNLLDGVDQKIGGGLLLIATTNHPQKLDSAINNRPGRFDLVIEIPLPDAKARELFFSARMLELDRPTIDKLTVGSERMSFAHLEEIIRSSGLIALRENRDVRTADDVMTALSQAQSSLDAAENNFLIKPEMPFGLNALRDARK